jgi:hypothetical protein
MRSLPVISFRWQYIRHVRLVFSQGGRPLTIYKPTRQTFVNIFRPRPAPRGLSLIALPLIPSEQSAFRARSWNFNLTRGYYWIHHPGIRPVEERSQTASPAATLPAGRLCQLHKSLFLVFCIVLPARGYESRWTFP